MTESHHDNALFFHFFVLGMSLTPPTKRPLTDMTISAHDRPAKQRNAAFRPDNDDTWDVVHGVTKRPSGKWQAQLYYAGKSRYIGVFEDRNQAVCVYRFIRKQLQCYATHFSTELATQQFQHAKKSALEAFKVKTRTTLRDPPVAAITPIIECEQKHVIDSSPSPVPSSVSTRTMDPSKLTLRFLFFKGLGKKVAADGCVLLTRNHPVLDQNVEDLIRMGDSNVQKVFSLTYTENAKVQRGDAMVQIICDRAKFTLESFQKLKVRDLASISSSSEISLVVSVEEEIKEKRTYILPGNGITSSLVDGH